MWRKTGVNVTFRFKIKVSFGYYCGTCSNEAHGHEGSFALEAMFVVFVYENEFLPSRLRFDSLFHHFVSLDLLQAREGVSCH